MLYIHIYADITAVPVDGPLFTEYRIVNNLFAEKAPRNYLLLRPGVQLLYDNTTTSVFRLPVVKSSVTINLPQCIIDLMI